jgi:serine/threonine protein kinase
MSDDTLSWFGPVGQGPGEPFHIGERISGCYHLRQLLGRGGTSHVFEADDSLLARRVAIKVSDDPQTGADLLIREARALAAIRHRGLPIVHGLGMHRGWTYLVLERLFGVTLEQHLEQFGRARRLGLDEGLAILESVAEVLAVVHGAGMAHRDLKPANVMLCRDRTVLLDFGIVTPEVDAGEMARCGTPSYVAPEVIRGVVAPGRAHLIDLYAFGTMAYEMFAARPAFEGSGMLAMLEHHLRTPAPELSAVRPELPSQLSELVHACMDKDPRERPGDLESVIGELRGLRRRFAEGTGPMRLGRGTVQGVRETYRRQTGGE